MDQASSRFPVFKFSIKVAILGRNLSLGDEAKLLIRQVLGSNDPAVAPLEAIIFGCGNDDEAITTVLGDRHQLGKGAISGVP